MFRTYFLSQLKFQGNFFPKYEIGNVSKWNNQQSFFKFIIKINPKLLYKKTSKHVTIETVCFDK
jgi:hypothetical protein